MIFIKTSHSLSCLIYRNAVYHSKYSNILWLDELNSINQCKNTKSNFFFLISQEVIGVWSQCEIGSSYSLNSISDLKLLIYSVLPPNFGCTLETFFYFYCNGKAWSNHCPNTLTSSLPHPSSCALVTILFLCICTNPLHRLIFTQISKGYHDCSQQQSISKTLHSSRATSSTNICSKCR